MKIKTTWRVAGAICLLTAFIMVLLSSRFMYPGMNKVVLVAYWVVFVILLMGALYAALLDLRFTRLEYKARERDLFRDTFMTEEFRQVLAEAQKRPPVEGPPSEKS